MKKDRIIKCRHCGQDFVWTAGDQVFYQEKGLSTPVKCLICRAIFKEAEKDQFRGKLGFKNK